MNDANGDLKRYGTKPEEREFIKAEVLDFVNSYYAEYRAGHIRSEPVITLALLFNHFETNKGWGGFNNMEFNGKAANRLILRGIVEGLRRQGKLGSSIGMSENGREARCYEPAR